jgi:hypothetical protein
MRRLDFRAVRASRRWFGRRAARDISSARLALRHERDGDDWRHLWAYLDADGALHLDGQDLGTATSFMTADGEYEWFQTIAPEHLPRLLALLGGNAGGDVMALLADRYTDAKSYELERILRESGIPVEFYSS